MWRLLLDRLPHRVNLSARGLEINSISCPVCDGFMESNDHLFFSCNVAVNIWTKIRVWCDVAMPRFGSNSEWIAWLDNWHTSKSRKDCMYGIISATLWMIWRYRNCVTFRSQVMRQSDVFDNIRLYSFSWCKFRGGIHSSWNDWINFPL